MSNLSELTSCPANGFKRYDILRGRVLRDFVFNYSFELQVELIDSLNNQFFIFGLNWKFDKGIEKYKENSEEVNKKNKKKRETSAAC